MGRSRGVSRLALGDHANRSKKRKTVLNASEVSLVKGAEETDNTVKGESKVSLYHCNYCNKDLSGVVRLKCAVCPDFDLCVECFSVGAQVTPHLSNHPYRVMDDLAFPLLSPDWNVDEEILLLEGIAMYGFGNWSEVAEHVGTKSKLDVINHYYSVYINSPCFPLPDLSDLMGKSREELISMNNIHDHSKQDTSNFHSGEMARKDVASFSVKTENEAPQETLRTGQSSALLNEVYEAIPSSTKSFGLSISSKEAIDRPQVKDSMIVEGKTVGKKIPLISREDDLSLLELNGYNLKRQEFETEYDNDAEHVLADMEFKKTENELERELKLRVLRIYSKRLDERKRRKDFILERNLLQPDLFLTNLSPDEKNIYQNLKVFMRFLSKEDYDVLIKNVIEENRITKRIHDLQDARTAGCLTSSEVNSFIEEKKKEAEKCVKHNFEALQKPIGEVDDVHSVPSAGPISLNASPHTSSPIIHQGEPNFSDNWDITSFLGSELLSDSERQACNEMRLLPGMFLKMVDTLSVEIRKGTVTSKFDAHSLFKVHSSKVDKLYDIVLGRGISKT